MAIMTMAQQVACCDDTGVCSYCDTAACLQHSDPPPVKNCETNGFTCGECHATCASIACAREYADPGV